MIQVIDNGNGTCTLVLPTDTVNALGSAVKDIVDDPESAVVWDDWALDAFEELNEALQSD